MFVIYNPAAGGGRSSDIWRQAAIQLDKRGVLYDAVTTTHPGHATELARQAWEAGQRDFVAVGGDGTLAEVLAAVFALPQHNDCRIGMIPAGTGNDFARLASIPLQAADAADVLADGLERHIDVGYVNGQPFVNMAGLGIDVDVMRHQMKLKHWLHGAAISYQIAVLTALIGYRFKQVTIKIDGKQIFAGEISIVAVGNGQYIGGGMHALPKAQADDGILDVCIIKRVPKMSFPSVLPKVVKGTHMDQPWTCYFQGKEVEIESDDEITMELDGNITQHTPAHITVSSGALRMFAPHV